MRRSPTTVRLTRSADPVSSVAVLSLPLAGRPAVTRPAITSPYLLLRDFPAHAPRVTTPTTVQLVVCRLGEQRVAWPADAVVEVVRAVAITPLPGAPRAVEGVINVRGALVPVLDLRARFGLVTPPVDPAEHMILVAAGGRTIACRVDQVDQIVTIPADAVTVPRGLTASARGIAGVATTTDGIVVVHDPAAFVSEQEALALAAVLETGPPAAVSALP